jgi:CRISPR-associated protein Cmr4
MGSRTFVPRGVLGLYTESPLHCGAESGSGYVDMPIQREHHSRFPVIPGSTIKGVLNDERDWGDDRRYFFGAAGDEQNKAGNAGAVSFGDGFLVAFPVRSSLYPFVWMTCPLIIDRTYRALGRPCPALARLNSGEAWGTAAGTEVLLEELQVAATAAEPSIFATMAELLPDGPELAYIRTIFTERLYVISDKDFSDLIETATEVVTRIRIDKPTGTTSVGEGQMFNEELVPRDTLFASVVRELSDSKREFPLDDVPAVIRLGGHETIGRGVTWVHRMALPRAAAAGGRQ